MSQVPVQPSKTERMARDIEIVSLAYSRSLNAMNNLIQMQIQDILDVSLEVRRELIEMDELEEYLEHSEDGVDIDDDNDEMPAADDEDKDASPAGAEAAARQMDNAKADIKAVGDNASKAADGKNDINPVDALVNAASSNIAKAMANTLAVQNQLNSIAISALAEGLSLIYEYDEDEDEL